MQGKFGDLIHGDNDDQNGQLAEAVCRSDLIRLCTFFGKRKSKRTGREKTEFELVEFLQRSRWFSDIWRPCWVKRIGVCVRHYSIVWSRLPLTSDWKVNCSFDHYWIKSERRILAGDVCLTSRLCVCSSRDWSTTRNSLSIEYWKHSPVLFAYRYWNERRSTIFLPKWLRWSAIR